MRKPAVPGIGQPAGETEASAGEESHTQRHAAHNSRNRLQDNQLGAIPEGDLGGLLALGACRFWRYRIAPGSMVLLIMLSRRR